MKALLKDDEGNPLTVDLNGELVEGEKDLIIPAGGLRILRTDGQGPLTVGWVTICSNKAVVGVILFGGSAGVAGVGSSQLLAKGFVAAMESKASAGINTGVAVVNLENSQITLQLRLLDAQNNLLATAELTLPGMGHRALFVNQLDWEAEPGVNLDFSNFNGLLRASTSGDAAATVIQTRPGVFATQPVVPSSN